MPVFPVTFNTFIGGTQQAATIILYRLSDTGHTSPLGSLSTAPNGTLTTNIQGGQWSLEVQGYPGCDSANINHPGIVINLNR
jgi:hypothetical protein